MPYARAGSDLEVDLSQAKIEKRENDSRLNAAYLGGRGTGTKLFWDRVPPETASFSPDNLLIFGVGLLTGTLAPGANWDGDVDALVGTGRGAMVWINQGGTQGDQDGTFALSGQKISGGQTRAVFLSDLDGDGDLGALIAGRQQAATWWNDGQAAFARSSQRFRYSRRHGLAIGDFDGDGRPDIFAAEGSTDYHIWFNQGNGTFL